MADLADLIARLQAAEGPDRGLDAEIAAAIQRVPEWPKYTHLPGCTFDFVPDERDAGWVSVYVTSPDGRQRNPEHCRPVPAYTASIDAALSLVPDGLPWEVGAFGDRATKFAATVFNADHTCPPERYQIEAPTPALALCIACLKARVAASDGGG
jgi:hypothetical protein